MKIISGGFLLYKDLPQPLQSKISEAKGGE